LVELLDSLRHLHGKLPQSRVLPNDRGVQLHPEGLLDVSADIGDVDRVRAVPRERLVEVDLFFRQIELSGESSDEPDLYFTGHPQTGHMRILSCRYARVAAS